MTLQSTAARASSLRGSGRRGVAGGLSTTLLTLSLAQTQAHGHRVTRGELHADGAAGGAAVGEAEAEAEGGNVGGA